MKLNYSIIDQIIENALTEDLPESDITSDLTIDANHCSKFNIVTRDNIILSGVDVAKRVFLKLDSNLEIKASAKDGDNLQKNTVIISGFGNTRSILQGERVALNILRNMSSIATMTKSFVNEVAEFKAEILDTRKTLPGLRMLQKYSVFIGGGKNHRFSLSDAILVKDNHIAACGGIANLLEKIKNFEKKVTVEIECDTLDQVEQVLQIGGADIILLDNMSNEQMKKAVKLVDGKIKLEASGNVNLQNVKEIAATGVDYISAGCLTNSPIPVDIGLDM